MRACRESGARRIYAAPRQYQHVRDGAQSLQESELRSGEKLRADHVDRHQLEGDYRASRETKQFLDTEYGEYKTILGELGLAK